MCVTLGDHVRCDAPSVLADLRIGGCSFRPSVRVRVRFPAARSVAAATVCCRWRHLLAARYACLCNYCGTHQFAIVTRWRDRYSTAWSLLGIVIVTRWRDRYSMAWSLLDGVIVTRWRDRYSTAWSLLDGVIVTRWRDRRADFKRDGWRRRWSDVGRAGLPTTTVESGSRRSSCCAGCRAHPRDILCT